MAGTAPFCAICQTPIAEGEAATACPACATPYHKECWDEVGGCAMYGCPQVPQTEKRADLEIPAGFWGRETKPCPACGQEIQALAVRCRHCRAELGSQVPQSRAEWGRAQRLAGARPALSRRLLWLSVACVLPFTAPIAGALGLWLWWQRRDEIAALPHLRRTIFLLALVLAGIEVAAIVLAMLLTSLAS